MGLMLYWRLVFFSFIDTQCFKSCLSLLKLAFRIFVTWEATSLV